MQFGLYLTPQVEGADEESVSINAIVEQAHRGDEAGFALLYLTEHHFDNYNAYCDPFLLGAHLAGYLKHAWLGYSVVLLPLTHPWRMVENFNTIDQLMQGRCIFGLGSAGGGLIMTDGLGRTRPDASRGASEHVVQVMLDAWAYRRNGAPPLQFETVYDRGTLTDALAPPAYRQPHPLLARGTNDADTIERCGQLGWPVMYGRGDVDVAARFVNRYTRALDGGGHAPDLVAYCKQWMAVTKLIYVGETDEAAQRDGMAMLEPYVNQVGFLRVPPVKRDVPLALATERIYFGNSREDVLRNIALIGSPDTVAAKLADYEAIGMHHMRCWFIFGAHCDFQRAQRSFELFTQEVMPRLDPEPVREPAPGVAARAAQAWPSVGA